MLHQSFLLIDLPSACKEQGANQPQKGVATSRAIPFFM
ncbi:hypothetical protein SynPROS91_00649 [Synechococcus sp. PROS-9-1]|nr:hypothetical protein SynPROS91_00649 [Synechococcus sp. PROS-9-1]